MLSTKRPHRSSTRGLFIGLALAPGILGVTSSVVDGLVERYELRRTTNELVEQLENARGEAVAKNIFVRVRRDGNQLVKELSEDGVTFVRDSVLLDLPAGVHVTVRSDGEDTRVTAPNQSGAMLAL